MAPLLLPRAPSPARLPTTDPPHRHRFRAIKTFTSPGSELRHRLAHYGYWRIESLPNPATTDFWLLLLRLPDQELKYLILPTAKLARLLSRSHNPDKISLLMAKAVFSFAGKPLTAANRLAVFPNASLLDTPENADLKMDAHLNNWGQLLR